MRKIIFGTIVISCFFIQPFLTAQQPWNIEEARTDQVVQLEITVDEGTWISLDVSPDGQKIVFDLMGHIYEMPIGGGEARAVTSGRSFNMFPRYSPDGTRIAINSDRGGQWTLWTIDSDKDSTIYNRVSSHHHVVVQPTWSKDGEALYGTAYDHQQNSTGTRYDMRGQQQVIFSVTAYQPVNHFEEHPTNGLIYFEHNDQGLYGSGSRIKTYNTQTGEVLPYVQRPGGAFNPTLSRDGKYLAYGHRDDQETVIVIRDIATKKEKVIARGLDRDHQEQKPLLYGGHHNYSWHPNNEELFYAKNGKITAVNIHTGEERIIPFKAKIERSINRSMRFEVPVADGKDSTRSHRWAHKTSEGILYEALGDIYLKSGGKITNLTNSPAHETSPVYNPVEKRLYYASWSDKEFGAIYSQKLNGKSKVKHSEFPSIYGGLTLSPDRKKLVYFRGPNTISQGVAIENMINFELMVLEDGKEKVITKVRGTGNPNSKLPLTVTFGDDGMLYYTEFIQDKLKLNRISPDGEEKQTLYTFPHSSYAILSPDLKWIAYREYHRNFITPFEFFGKELTVSAFDNQRHNVRIHEADGPYINWSDTSDKLSWVRAGHYYEKSLDDVLNNKDTLLVREPIAIQFDTENPSGYVAFTNARVITMNEKREVLEGATVLVQGNRIEAIGTDIPVPGGYREFDLKGHTIMPGIVDAHAHYGANSSQFNVTEQRLATLNAALAHGVTTMFELYGAMEKDFWLIDKINKGDIVAPRLFSTGIPVFGLRFFRNKTFRPIRNLDEAREHVALNQEKGAMALKDYLNQKRRTRHMLVTAAREAQINVVSETAGDPPMSFTQVIDGVSGLEHSPGVSPLYKDAIELIKASGVGVTPTLIVVYNGQWGQMAFNHEERIWEDEKLLNFLPKEWLLTNRRKPFFFQDDIYAYQMAGEMKKLFDEGVLINLGAHGQMPGLDAHWEMELLVRGGFKPVEALQIATINGATYHGLSKDLGSLEVGKMADLVILERNPLEDIKNTRSIRYVMKNGVLYQGMDLKKVYPYEAAPQPFYFNMR